MGDIFAGLSADKVRFIIWLLNSQVIRIIHFKLQFLGSIPGQAVICVNMNVFLSNR